MTTTSLKLPDDLKQRAADDALRLGISLHAFMVQAIEQVAAAAEWRVGFIANAQAACKLMLASGKGYDANVVPAYHEARAVGRKTAPPSPKHVLGLGKASLFLPPLPPRLLISIS